MTNFATFRNHKPLGKLLYTLAAPRAKLFTGKVTPYLNPKDKILDIGAGICDIDKLLMDADFQITPLDIKNLSLNDISPILYDGKRMPFQDKSFDVALLLTVLHHTADPEHVLREARRVAQKIIIIEDIFSTPHHRRLTLFMDSLLNFEFVGHPHSNKTDAEWRALFKDEDMHLSATDGFHSFVVMKHQLYCVE